MRIDSKLIRDKIPELIQKGGAHAVTHIAGDEEYQNRLIEKLLEECMEFTESQQVEELADILEVVYALSALQGIQIHELEAIRQKKAGERGGFKKRIILDDIKRS